MKHKSVVWIETCVWDIGGGGGWNVREATFQFWPFNLEYWTSNIFYMCHEYQRLVSTNERPLEDEIRKVALGPIEQ
jgi:hypothetical protein